MASPKAAWRPWPTCKGPVGLAETNSTSTLLGWAACSPKHSAACNTSCTTACLAASFKRMLMKPGPAISMASTQRKKAGVASRALRRVSDSCRGFCLRALASCIAAVQARSPWAATLGDSKAARAPAPVWSFSSSAAKAVSKCCLAESIERDFTGAGGLGAAVPPSWAVLSAAITVGHNCCRLPVSLPR